MYFYVSFRVSVSVAKCSGQAGQAEQAVADGEVLAGAAFARPWVLKTPQSGAGAKQAFEQQVGEGAE